MTDTAGRRRVLFVTPAAPHLDAHEGGRRVMAGTINAVAAWHDVGLLHLCGPDEEHDVGSLAGICHLVEAVARPVPNGQFGRVTRYVRLAGGVAKGRPLWAGRCHVPACSERLRRVVDSWQPHIVQFEYHVMGQYADAIAGGSAGRVLVEHEPGERAASDARRTTGRAASALIAAADHVAWRRYERRVTRAVDRVVVFTEADRAALAAVCDPTRIVCIPFGVTMPAQPAHQTGSPPSVLFVGNFRHYPNEDAARWLIADIFPIIRLRHPGVRLQIVGSDPPNWLRQAAGEHVEVLGDVPDVQPYLDRATVVVAPIRLGGGMRVKVGEALAAGKPVVSSPLGIQGFANAGRPPVLVASSTGEFAAFVGQLIDSCPLRAEMAAAARRWATQHLSWNQTAAAFAEMYDSILKDRAAVAGSAAMVNVRA